MKHNLIFIGLLILCFGCDQSTVNSADAPTNPFFDLKNYFEEEMKIDRGSITKTTIFEGKKETVELNEVDLEKELKIFADANLNKVSWYEKYKIESQQTNEGNTNISYATDDPKLKTKRVDIFKTNEKLDSILIHNQMKSMIMDSDQYLAYYPNVGYSIKIKQIGSIQNVGDVEIQVMY